MFEQSLRDAVDLCLKLLALFRCNWVARVEPPLQRDQPTHPLADDRGRVVQTLIVVRDLALDVRDITLYARQPVLEGQLLAGQSGDGQAELLDLLERHRGCGGRRHSQRRPIVHRGGDACFGGEGS